MISVGLILTRKPGEISLGLLPVVAALAGTALPLLARPGGIALVPALLSMSLMLGGLSLSILSKVYLNRSFGIVAANRGIKIGGPYRVVRHPMYLGYIISQIGFLAASFNYTNLAFYLAAWLFQIVRIYEEENILFCDPRYSEFASRVSKRLIPGIF
jgi:protein-S-isoprenylcysteine O-methyltransferase Ste14